jgi:hypothetical protein
MNKCIKRRGGVQDHIYFIIFFKILPGCRSADKSKLTKSEPRYRVVTFSRVYMSH